MTQRPRPSRNVAALTLVVAACGLAACSGGIDSPTPGSAPPGPGGGVSGTAAPFAGGTGGLPLAGTGPANGAGTGGSGAEPPVDTCAGAVPAARVVLATSRQYANALRDLLGQSAVSDDDFASTDDLEVDITDRPWVTTSIVDARARLAEQAVETLRGTSATFLSCGALTDRACVRRALERIGLRAWKRPLDAEELDDLMTLYDAELVATPDDEGESAALLALQALVSAPSSLYRTELMGEPASAAGTLSAYELAAQLGAFLLDSVPDDALLAAAGDGSLLTPAGMQTQLDRLLALPRVRDHLTELVLTAMRVPNVFETPKDETLFPEYTPALQTSMYEESRRFVDDVLWTRGANLNELLTSRSSFVDPALAEIYGIPAPAGSGFSPVQLPESRAGLLTQPSVLSVLSRTDKTSVVARGLFVRLSLLCLPKISSPPDSVAAQVAMQLSASSTQEELAAYRAMTSPCMSCHANFDRFGLLLEGFDPIGRERMTHPAPIDFVGLLDAPAPIESPRALAELITGDGTFVACLARRSLAYALTSAFEPSPACSDDPIDGTIASGGGTMAAMIRALVDEPAFRTRSEEP